MDRIFEGDDTEEVVGMARELLPASMVAASIVASLTGIEPERLIGGSRIFGSNCSGDRTADEK